MAHSSSPRRSLVLALLATTAAASLLGACAQTSSLTNGFFSRGSDEVQMTAEEAAGATAQWAAAYAKNPKDPQMALGYARTLRAIGSKERSLDILHAAYRANPNDGEIAAELGRVALDMGRVDVAAKALDAAEAKGVNDWKTLSAQGTLSAKKGDHAEAQKYYQAALQKNPESASVINNLALSYALDGKADDAETLLRQAAETGHDDKRIRQNLAMVLGVQGKFDEAREVAAVDMTGDQAKSSMAYLQNMLNKPTQVASAAPSVQSELDDGAEDWSPFGYDEPTPDPVPAAKSAKPVQTASNTVTTPDPAKVQVVTPVAELTAPGKPTQVTGAPAAPTPPPPPVSVDMPTPTPRAKIIQVPDALPVVRASVTTPVSTNTTLAKSTPAVVTAPASPTMTSEPVSSAAGESELIIEIIPPKP